MSIVVGSLLTYFTSGYDGRQSNAEMRRRILPERRQDGRASVVLEIDEQG
jgi:hypothetical protein